MAKIGVGTGFGTARGTTINVYFINPTGEAVFVSSDGTPSSIIGSVAGYSTGCLAIDTTTGVLYYNAGTSTTSSFTAV